MKFGSKKSENFVSVMKGGECKDAVRTVQMDFNGKQHMAFLRNFRSGTRDLQETEQEGLGS